MVKNKKLLLFLLPVLFFVAAAVLWGMSGIFAYAADGEDTAMSFVEVSGEGITEENTYYLAWSSLEVTYDGKPHAPSAVLKCQEDAVFERQAAISVSKEGEPVTAVAADEYVAVASCEGVTFTSGNENTFTISPRQAVVQWNIAETYTYDGSLQGPTASYINVQDETVTLNSTGAASNAGVRTASVAADAAGSNYILTNLTCEYTILPLQVTVQWNTAEQYTFNGSSQGPVARYSNIYGENIVLNADGYAADAGEHIASVASNAAGSNYLLTNLTCEYTIAPLQAAVQWSVAESYTFNGSPQGPAASYQNIDHDAVILPVSGRGTDAGSYTASVAADAAGGNYVLTNLTQEYSIGKLSAAVEWVTFDFVENGEVQAPQAFVAGLGGEIIELPVVASGRSAGDYTARVDADAADTNFVLSGELSAAYTIAPKEAFGTAGTIFCIILGVCFAVAIVWIVLLLLKNKTANPVARARRESEQGARFKKQMQEKDAAYRQLQERVKKIEAAYSQAQTKAQKAEVACRQLQELMKKAKAENRQLQERAARTEAENRQLQEHAAKAEADYGKLQENLQETVAACLHFEKRSEQLTAEKGQLERHVAELTAEKGQREKHVAELTAEKGQLEGHVAELTTKKEQLEGLVTELTAEKEQFEERIVKSDVEKEKLVEERDDLQKALRLVSGSGYPLEVYLPEIKAALEEAETIKYDGSSPEFSFQLQRQQFSKLARILSRYKNQRGE